MAVRVRCDTCHNEIDNDTLAKLFEIYTLYRNGLLGDSAFLGQLFKVFTNASFKEVTDCFDEDEASELSYLL